MSAALADADADLENADPGDFGGLDASDADLHTALTVLPDDISDVAEAVGDALPAPGRGYAVHLGQI